LYGCDIISSRIAKGRPTWPDDRKGDDMKLKGRVAIITGGARGLGKAFALRLAEEGARIAVADILDAGGVRDEIVAKGGEALATYTDVSNEESVGSMVRAVSERFGRIDILVNDAGIFATLGRKPFFEIPAGEWDRVLSINLKGMFLCSKAVYPYMKMQGKGKIINITSSTFFDGVPGFAHYVSSKGGIIALTRVMARELGDDNICVNAVAPGLTTTEVVKTSPMYPEEHLKTSSAKRCFKRTETPADLTGAVLFLASDDSDFITGQTLLVDGGASFH
jgi:NAD(P)-dependent dehydrogenase (short-subunit alcohol dehydrogenase family)